MMVLFRQYFHASVSFDRSHLHLITYYAIEENVNYYFAIKNSIQNYNY